MEGDFPDFESIKRTHTYGGEYWSARDLAPLLGYNKWQNFDLVIQRAMDGCKLAKQEVARHFLITSKLIPTGKGAIMSVKDYYLTRYAFHLVLISSDVKKAKSLQALAYFALISLDKNIDIRLMANELGISISSDIATTTEQKTIGQIMNAFKHLRMVQQYKILPYYIDLYFLDHKIAVECDEWGHRRYPPEVEQKRQQYIEQKLRCVFVRYNPNITHFNIGDVIN